MVERPTDLENINFRVRGLIKPGLTPLMRVDGKLLVDTESQMRQIRQAAMDGTEVFFATANAGEGTKLDWENWQIAAQTSVAAARGWGMPVVVGILRSTWEETIAGARFAQQIKADAVVWAPVLTPEGMSQEGLLGLFQATDLPIFLYNNPGDFPGALTLRFVQWASAFDRVRGIKDTSRDEQFLQKLLRLRRQGRFSVFQGDTRGKLAGVEQADGMVAMQANVAPDLIRQYFDYPSEALRQQVLGVCDWTHEKGLKGMKSWLVQQGIFATDLMWGE